MAATARIRLTLLTQLTLVPRNKTCRRYCLIYVYYVWNEDDTAE
jgi:hypothetical protein